MKKTIAILLIAVSILTLFAACAAKDQAAFPQSEENAVEETAAPAADTDEQLFGMWHCSEATIPYGWSAVSTYIAFRADGTFTMDWSGTSFDGIYRAKDGMLAMNADVSFSYTSDSGALRNWSLASIFPLSYTVDGNRLIMRKNNGTLTFIRQSEP